MFWDPASDDEPPVLAASQRMIKGRPPGVAVLDDRLYMVWKGVSSDESIWWSSFSFDGSAWAAQQQIPNVGTSVGPSLGVLPVGGGTGGVVLLAAWKGVDGDENIWWSTFDGTYWANQEQIPNVGTSSGPSLGASGYRLAAAWKGMEGDERIWWSTLEDAGWAAQQQIPNVGTSVGPSLAPGLSAQFSAAWKGIEGDERIWWSSISGDGAGWAAQQQIPGVGTSVGPSLCKVYDTAADAPALFAVWKGIEGDENMYWSTLAYGDTSWATQQQIPGVGTGP